MKIFDQLVAEAAAHVTELMPWDLADKIQTGADLLLIDVREPTEFAAMHIADAINIPRGIIEAAAETGYDETDLCLANARNQQVTVIYRSGKRSCLTSLTLQQLGFKHIASLKTGLHGWSDYNQPLVNQHNVEIDGDIAEQLLLSRASN